MNNFELSKSDRMRLELSVRVGCGRLCDYCPQELYIARFKQLKNPGDRWLTMDTIREISSNIPTETVISWTGFTEPFDCKEFEEIVLHFAERGMDQLINTTLYGLKKNKEFFLEHINLFKEGITLHLPDGQGYMKGNFDASYTAFVQSVIDKLVAGNLEKFDFFLIGEDFHPSIKDTVEAYESAYGSHRIIKAKFLNTRSAAVDVGSLGLKATQALRSEGKTFHCTYKRLNRGVLLPNGSVVICCQDYGLEGVLGSLKTMNLREIYSVIENSPTLSKQFIEGRFSPCINCEHYSTVDALPSVGRA